MAEFVTAGEGDGLIPESIPPTGGGNSTGLARCPPFTSRGEKEARVTHGYWSVKLSGLPLRTRADVGRFLALIQEEGFAGSTQSMILSTILSVY